MDSIDILYCGVQMSVNYYSERVDYGVSGSPEWTDLEINGVQIGGVEVFEMLTRDQVNAISEIVLEKIRE